MFNPFDEMMIDIVTLKKSNGEVYEGIKSSVQTDKIFIDDGSLPIEEGDHLIRKLKNGLSETYEVLDRGYHESFYDIPEGYQCKVRKITSIPRNPVQSTIHNTTYNLHGPNSRVNNNSTDSSFNTVNQVSNVFSDLKETIRTQIEPVEVQSELITLVNELEADQGNTEYVSKYKRFVDAAADHMKVIGPFIPLLTKFI